MKKAELPITSINMDNNQELKDLLQKNLEIAQKNLEVSEGILICTKYIKRYIFWKRVAGITLWVLILVSTVGSLFYLPTLIKELQTQMTTVTRV
jgi:hypothetical protein